MKILNYLSFLLIIFIGNNVFSQKEAFNWYFGNEAGLSFHTIPPTALTDSKMILGDQNCASISDSLGNLLFYTNGNTVWNKNHDTLKNGDSLILENSDFHSALIIKQPDSHLYFIFCAETYKNLGLFYSILDMDADSGRGEIIKKNIFLFRNSNLIAATHHANKKDIWIAGLQNFSDTIYFYQITNKGINKNPLIQKTGIPLTYVLQGEMKFSNQGKKLIFGRTISFDADLIHSFDFDNKTGLLSNANSLISDEIIKGFEFSPSDKFVYFSVETSLWQCPIKILNKDSYIDSECQLIYDTLSSNTHQTGAMILQLGPDAKIYCTGQSYYSLSTILNPDSLGLKCDFKTSNISLEGKRVHYALPLFIQSSIYPAYLRSENDCFGDTTEIIFQNSVADSIYWDLGDGNWFYSKQNSFKKIFADSGIYSINAIAFNANTIDTFSYKLYIQKIYIPNLVSDTLICSGSGFSINAFDKATDQYFWNKIQLDSVYFIADSGKYVLEVSNEACQAKDSIHVRYVPCGFTVKNLCYGDAALFDLTTKTADSVRWHFGDESSYSTNNFYVSTGHGYADSGKYWVIAQIYKYGLSVLDSQLISIYRPIVPVLGNDTIICNNEKITLRYNPVLYPNFEWNDGSKNQEYEISATGKYSLTVEDKGCKSIALFNLKALDCGISSQNFCLGDTTLIALNSSEIDSVFWDFGDGNSEFSFKNNIAHFFQNGGIFNVKTKAFWKKIYKEINTQISITKLPEIVFDRNSVCEEGFLNVLINEPDIQYFWSNGSQSKSIQVLESGNYKLIIQKNGCKTSDSIDIKVLDCVCRIYIPNAFTPNKDGLNDGFSPIVECEASEYYFSIHNRWGELIFETNNPQNTWNGTYNNADCPDGIYIYMARIKYPINGGNHYKISNLSGIVNLLR